MPDKLIIFDYSGTLSLEMAEFSRPDNLLQQLRQCGLYGLGVYSLDLFWNIVNATWIEGSTTKLGYKKVLTKYISGLFPEKAATEPMQISAAVAAFAAAYFAHSHLDEHWRPVLKKLARDESMQVVIATDHYAEATETIVKYLQEWDIKATPLMSGGKRNFVIANSADLGVHKSEKRFWEIIRGYLPELYSNILLVDDFGQNEQKSDNYRLAANVAERRKKTVNLLQDVFSAPVKIISIGDGNKSLPAAIVVAATEVNNFL